MRTTLLARTMPVRAIQARTMLERMMPEHMMPEHMMPVRIVVPTLFPNTVTRMQSSIPVMLTFSNARIVT